MRTQIEFLNRNIADEIKERLQKIKQIKDNKDDKKRLLELENKNNELEKEMKNYKALY